MTSGFKCRRPHLTLIVGGKTRSDDQTQPALHPARARVVRDEPRPVPRPRPFDDGPQAA